MKKIRKLLLLVIVVFIALFDKQIPSPSGNPKWSRAGIDKIITNEKYLLHGMIGIEKFVLTQDYKAERCRYMQSMI